MNISQFEKSHACVPKGPGRGQARLANVCLPHMNLGLKSEPLNFDARVQNVRLRRAHMNTVRFCVSSRGDAVFKLGLIVPLCNS